jgi:WbqC-like protein family
MHKVMSADIFVYLDTVQFSKNGLQNRNQIKTANGPLWLTVPVKHQLGHSIAATEIADNRATEKHWKTLTATYSRTPGFELWREELRELLTRPHRSLANVAIASTEWMLEKLNVNVKRVLASEIPGVQGHASELVASICKELGATEYLTGTGALAYMNLSDFSDFDCGVLVQQWTPITYNQKHMTDGFTSDLSTLDLLLNCPDQAAAMIGNAGSWRPLHQEHE